MEIVIPYNKIMRRDKPGQPPKVRRNKKIVRLRDEENMSFREIAREVNIDVKAVHRIYHRLKSLNRPEK